MCGFSESMVVLQEGCIVLIRFREPTFLNQWLCYVGRLKTNGYEFDIQLHVILRYCSTVPEHILHACWLHSFEQFWSKTKCLPPMYVLGTVLSKGRLLIGHGWLLEGKAISIQSSTLPTPIYFFYSPTSHLIFRLLSI